ncbi:hypothetical protein [Streptomyces platensis]
MGELDDSLLVLVDSVVDEGEERLPLLTLREACATVALLQLLAQFDGEGVYAARHRTGNLTVSAD